MENLPESKGNFSALPTTEGVASLLHARRVVADRYEILSRLGKGGMGEVWHAYDLKLRVDVALKSLRLDLKTNEDRVEALRREVRTAREVISPNVCRIFDLVVEEDRELISMEYIDGITLTALLVKKGRMELREARDIAAQFLAGLEAIHQAGLVHRDLKPENIMITRTGRVVVMDFGIAKQVAQIGGTIAGTVPYMSPEQLAGEKVDARSDVFSAGVVLAEMIHPEGVYSQKTREEIWNAVRHHPMQLPDSPWKGVIKRAVAEKAENRFASAGALARALEEVTQRVETIEERKPYPGLASFTAADAEYFFGRELEVETVIKKLQQLHLMALIGPSGAGKTSLLRAGLIPALPSGWSHIFCTPGDAPLVNLGQSLAPEFTGDTEAIRKMVRLDDIDVALWLLQRWRQKHPEALLIVDRFEELFTLNSSESQSRFAELIGRCVLDADVRVLLVMRDDFLIFCKEHLSLAPIFSELTAMLPLGGASLRRALLQPALKCGYRFEDESLVDEILVDIEKERGALPLMAFAAARLWEKRDRQNGQLTRSAYKEIGGVAGALAQHAEETMDRIGTERQPIVREIFRNLITAQNTRAARDTEELLSVFPEKQSAQEVLRKLIDARLLTSFEAPQTEGEKPKRRVEIIHESLLSNWPRLVRWQTQDADSAQLRDQLRQAAQLWEQRSRSEDLLWTGTAFREFQLWRERYAGGLSTTEEAFATAMVNRATKRRRQRRLTVITMFIVLLSILALVSKFWRAEKSARAQSETERKKAVSESYRREAAQLLALGRLKMNDYPTAALAYAIASLEKSDTPEGRRFAVEALSHGPTAFVLPQNVNFLHFSQDGKWLATGGRRSGISLLSREGGPPKLLSPSDGSYGFVRFGPNSDLLAGGGKDVRLWSIPDATEISKAETVHDGFYLTKSQLITISPRSKEKTTSLQSWPIPFGGPKRVSDTFHAEYNMFDIDPSGDQVVYSRDQEVYLTRLKDFPAGKLRLLHKHHSKVVFVAFNRTGNHVISADQDGEIRFSRLINSSSFLEQMFRGRVTQNQFLADQAGSKLAAFLDPSSSTEIAAVWDLDGPPDSDPVILNAETPLRIWMSIHPEGQWLATANGGQATLWPLNRSYPHVLRGHSPPLIQVRFTHDGKHLVSSSGDGTVRLWPLSRKAGEKSRVIMEDKTARLGKLSLDQNGPILTASIGDNDPRIFVFPIGGSPRQLSATPHGAEILAAQFATSGRVVASSHASSLHFVRIWNLDSQTHHDIHMPIEDEEPGCGWGTSDAGMVMDLGFTSDGRLITGGRTGLRIWDLDKKSSKLIRPCKKELQMEFDLSADGRVILLTDTTPTRLKPSVLSVIHLNEQRSHEIASHGNRVSVVALDSAGKVAVTGDQDGVVRVGPITGEEPHLLFGHRLGISSVAISPDGRWIASGSDDGMIRLWPLPQGQPFHTLPYQELMERLRGMTNLRVIPDSKADTGYKLEPGPFPGWEKAPEW